VDGLTKGIKQWIKSNYRAVKLIHFDQDHGIPARRNTGLMAVNPNSEYVVFMDEDVTVSENWLLPLVETMESDSTIGCVQPLMLRKDKPGEVDNAGCYIDAVGYPHKFGMDKYKSANEIRDVSYAETAAMLVRHQIVNKMQKTLEPFDSDYLVHWYDIDFCWRVLLSGYRVVINPRSVVYHERRLSSGSGRLPYQNIFLNSRNRLTTLVKNYSLTNLARLLFLYILLEIARVMVLLKYQPLHAIATLAGNFWVLRNLKKLWKKRTLVQKMIRKVPDSFVMARFNRFNLMRLYYDFQRNYGK
jgi:hypothetical protein